MQWIKKNKKKASIPLRHAELIPFSVFVYLSFVNMSHLFIAGSMKMINRTRAPSCPLSEGRPAASLLLCSQGRGSQGYRVPGVSLLRPVLRRSEALHPGSRWSHYSHLASSFVNITWTSQRDRVANKGFMELFLSRSSLFYFILFFHTERLLLTVMHHSCY